MVKGGQERGLRVLNKDGHLGMEEGVDQTPRTRH